jgi:hypothetical protein
VESSNPNRYTESAIEAPSTARGFRTPWRTVAGNVAPALESPVERSVSIPEIGRRFVLGTWQGIYLWEHRLRRHRREWCCTCSARHRTPKEEGAPDSRRAPLEGR